MVHHRRAGPAGGHRGERPAADAKEIPAMSTSALDRTELRAFAAAVRERANAQYRTASHQRLFSVPLNTERGRYWLLQVALWSINRRDCWAFAQGLSPLDVKRLVWLHEQDELDGNKARGVEDHFALQVREGRNLGLTPADYAAAQLHPGTRTCAYAWIHLVKDSPWLKAISACAGLEISNSAEWVDGGGMSYRMGKRFEEQLGIPFDRQVSNVEHAEVDVEHSAMLMQIAERHGTSQDALDLMRAGVFESWDIETVWKGQLADMLEAIPGP
jgi:hypothetical protein